MNVPNKALRKKDCCRDTKSPAQKNFRKFLSEKQRKAQEEEEVTTKDSQANAVGKKQQCAQNAIYRETSPRKAKRPTTPSLKRHVAWEYPESAAHHKYLF